MVFKQYDWYEDRIAFLKIDKMKNNLWNLIDMKRLIIKIKFKDLDLDRIENAINNSVWNKIKQ